MAKQFIVDAFADKIFCGNPAAVCVIEKWPDDSIMQKIAKENNLSETAFIVKEKSEYHIRWFTPRYEIDLCGHATLASAYTIHKYFEMKSEEIRFISNSGLLKVKCKEDCYTLDFPSRPAEKISAINGLEKILKAEITELYLSRDLMAIVKDEETVKNLDPDFTKMAELEIGDGVIVTSKGRSCDFVSRCFYPKCGVNEDPVTGSAHCNLIPYWSKRLNKTELTALQLSERGGKLICRNCGERVEISGNAVLFGITEIFLNL